MDRILTLNAFFGTITTFEGLGNMISKLNAVQIFRWTLIGVGEATVYLRSSVCGGSILGLVALYPGFGIRRTGINAPDFAEGCAPMIMIWKLRWHVYPNPTCLLFQIYDYTLNIQVKAIPLSNDQYHQTPRIARPRFPFHSAKRHQGHQPPYSPESISSTTSCPL